MLKKLLVVSNLMVSLFICAAQDQQMITIYAELIKETQTIRGSLDLPITEPAFLDYDENITLAIGVQEQEDRSIVVFLTVLAKTENGQELQKISSGMAQGVWGEFVQFNFTDSNATLNVLAQKKVEETAQVEPSVA